MINTLSLPNCLYWLLANDIKVFFHVYLYLSFLLINLIDDFVDFSHVMAA